MLNVTTLSAKKAMSPGTRNFLMINLDFVYEEQPDKDNATVFILDNTMEMTEFVENSTKYRYAISFIKKYIENMTESDMVSVIKMSDEKTPIVKMSKAPKLSQLEKSYPDGLCDIFFSLYNAKSILDNVKDKKYNKSIVILSNQDAINYGDESLYEIGRDFYNEGIRITTISLNEFAQLGILPIITNGNYYSMQSRKHFERIIHKELWTPDLLLGRDIEIILPRNSNIEWKYNLEGYQQGFNGNKSIWVYIPKSFGHNEIIIPYTVKNQQGLLKFDIKVKFKDYKSSATKRTKVDYSINVKNNNYDEKYERETIVYKAMYEFKNSIYSKIDKLIKERKIYDAIDELYQYIYELRRFSDFVSATKPIEVMTREANSKIKELKKMLRPYKK